MWKKFLLGFALGLFGMHYYLNYGEEVMTDASEWAETSASRYRGDQTHQKVDDLLRDKGL